MHEQVVFDQKQVTSLDWVTYPILRFKDTPKIDFQFIQRTDIPATNTGNAAGERHDRAVEHGRRSGVFVGARASRR